ncbi:MAG: DUF115 domain-containing protein [Treponema sp.]|nr:DUF115 domain-containing protein [Treponema sp.]
MQSYYKDIIKAKNEELIPVLQNGKTIESLYNPQKDAERKIQSLSVSETFYIIYGLGSGILIEELIKKNPKSKIICLEFSETDINFLSNISRIKNLFQNPNIKIISKEKFYECFINEYLPSIHGNLQIIEQNNYFSVSKEYENFIKQQTKQALQDISKDYSVQAHFGKLWQHNILNNIKQTNTFHIENFPTEKTCLILAAGPNLENYISEIKNNDNKYFIIATDTAFSTALKFGIECNIVVTLDAQNISINHFTKKIDKGQLFLLDYSSSPSIAKKIQKHNKDLLFFTSGHPLATYFTKKNINQLTLTPGSGTVTIAALDFAIKAGFCNIKVIGADFSYPKNKPYCKGTYLDYLYNKNSTKITQSETTFCKLMYRTELIEENQIKTTETLKSYRDSFEKYLKSQKINFYKEQNCYVIKKNYENINKEFSNEILYSRESIISLCSDDITRNKALLPYMAYCRKQNPDFSVEKMEETAIKDLKRFTIL